MFVQMQISSTSMKELVVETRELASAEDIEAQRELKLARARQQASNSLQSK
jgi:hypothetical protein